MGVSMDVKNRWGEVYTHLKVEHRALFVVEFTVKDTFQDVLHCSLFYILTPHDLPSINQITSAQVTATV